MIIKNGTIYDGIHPGVHPPLREGLGRKADHVQHRNRHRGLDGCNTNIPDRTAALLHGGTDPVPELTAAARNLERGGAQGIAMPCNRGSSVHPRIRVCAPLSSRRSMVRRAAEAALREGGIAAIGPGLEPVEGERVLDAAGRRVYPGFVCWSPASGVSSVTPVSRKERW